MIWHDRIRILAGKLLEQDTYVFFTCRQLVNLLSWRAAVVVDPHPGKDLLDPTVWMLASGNNNKNLLFKVLQKNLKKKQRD